MSRDHRRDFEDWEIRIASKLITQFQRRWTCLHREDFEDLLQECLCHWHFSKNSYDPRGEASQKTYMARVIANRLMDLVREKETDKRKMSHLVVSLDDPPRTGALTGSVRQGSTDCFRFDPRKHIELKIDISITLRKLTPYQRELCHLLGEGDLTVKEVSTRLKVARSSIYDEIKRIRSIFRREHLEEYLEDFSDTPGK